MVDCIHYEIILYWSGIDQAFIAEVPELSGCAADGATYQEALANMEVIIREWMETACELGRPVPEPRGRLMYAGCLRRFFSSRSPGCTARTVP